jgi:hypothetical protein
LIRKPAAVAAARSKTKRERWKVFMAQDCKPEPGVDGLRLRLGDRDIISAAAESRKRS